MLTPSLVESAASASGRLEDFSPQAYWGSPLDPLGDLCPQTPDPIVKILNMLLFCVSKFLGPLSALGSFQNATAKEFLQDSIAIAQ